MCAGCARAFNQNQLLNTRYYFQLIHLFVSVLKFITVKTKRVFKVKNCTFGTKLSPLPTKMVLLQAHLALSLRKRALLNI